MDKVSLAQPRPAFVDESLLTELSELTCIPYQVLFSAFTGEHRGVALDAIKKVVAENLDGTPEVWGEELRELARVKGLGEYRPGYWDGYELTYEYNDFLRSIGRL